MPGTVREERPSVLESMSKDSVGSLGLEFSDGGRMYFRIGIE